MTEKNYNPNQKENKGMKKAEVAKDLPPMKTEEKVEDKKTEKISEKKEVQKVKMTETVVRGISIHGSTKKAADLCRFIKNKKVEEAIKLIDEVAQGKRFIHAKGEYAHKAGLGSAKMPVDLAKEVKILLKSGLGNARNHEIEEPYVYEAIANIASRPYGRFGKYRRKTSHITIKIKGANKK